MGEHNSINSIDVDGVFIGAGCNRVVNTVAWGPSNLVAFGAHHAVAIFHPQAATILTTLPGHRDIVNCIEWLPRNKDICKDCFSSEEQFLLSGSADGVIIIWACHSSQEKWRQVMEVPKAHRKGVTCIAGVMLTKLDAVFASTSSDGTVHIWEITFPSQAGGKKDEGGIIDVDQFTKDAKEKVPLKEQVMYNNLTKNQKKKMKRRAKKANIRTISNLDVGDCTLSLTQTICVGARAMVTLSLQELPGNDGNLILAMGGLDNKVHLYVGERTGKFMNACELKGHQDWIRGLDFSIPASREERKEILLASCSQDRSIRIWKIAFRISSDATEEAKRVKDVSLKTYIEGPVFKAGDSIWQVSLESLLVGHEDWVYSVKWQPPLKNSIDENKDCWLQPQSILSASMDRTMMIWRPESKSGIWINEVTVGELSHSALGFYGGLWGPRGDAILAHGYGGSFHLWKNIGVSAEQWQPQLVPSGHSAAVLDLAWAKSNQFILSASHDQTTRIFAPWERNRCGKERKISWHEVARPQVHGHDINSVAIIRGRGNHRYVSGADEKVGRVFEAPLSFLQTLHHTASGNLLRQDESNEDIQILGANMSALGLSQKPIYVHGPKSTAVKSVENDLDVVETIPDAIPVVLTEPPLEENLASNTLWPESHKLYGHGNELFAMCCAHNGEFIATACKAQSANVAEIWLWHVGSWRVAGHLHSHVLTVTQMEFSSDDRYLLSVSRDRHLSIFELGKTAVGEIKHELIARHDAHKRIIWSCSWSTQGYTFATGSRDKTVKIWKVEETVEGRSSVKQIALLPQFSSSVTALSWSPQTNFGDDLLAIGMENGLIEMWSIRGESKAGGGEHLQALQRFEFIKASRMLQLDFFMCHVATVHRLVWKKTSEISDRPNSSSSEVLQIASCGADHTVRMFNVTLA